MNEHLIGIKKVRHIKTFPEKFGHTDVKEEAKAFIDGNYKRMKPQDIFNACPYVGIVYVPMNGKYELWYDMEEPDLEKYGNIYVKLKILEIKGDYVWFIHYDSHHKELVLLERKHTPYLIYGNDVIINPDYENKPNYDENWNLKSV